MNPIAFSNQPRVGRLLLAGLGCACLLNPMNEINAESADELSPIATLGELNGIALQCGYRHQVERIKHELLLVLPRKRELGEWFEIKTNESFLRFMANNDSCPSAPIFAQRLDAAITRLNELYQ
jgi:hypothetical protein